MTKIIHLIVGSLLICTTAIQGNILDLSLMKYYQQNSVKGKNEHVDDYTMVRRLYIDIAGRIPSYEEINAYVQSQNPAKKEQLLDKLLYSEDYVNNWYNFFADLLRVRHERLSDNIGLLKSYPYVDYIRTSLREDKSYNTWVSEMLAAEGRFTENPATGYHLRDNGMAIDNLATTTQIFLGKNLSCAQCHDDPFQDYTQKQYYELFAFFGSQENRSAMTDYNKKRDQIDKEIKEITGTDRIDNTVRQLLASNIFDIHEKKDKETKLPHDYQYKDGKPNDIVKPVSLDRKVRNITKSRREEFAKWLTNQPDFSYTIVNRIWKEIVGEPLLWPIDNIDVDSSPEGLIVKTLGDYFKNEQYSIKKLIRIIVSSDFYSRVSFVGSDEDYKFQSLKVKRLTSAQLWDSIVTLVLPDPNYSKINYASYSKVVHVDFDEMTGQSLLDQVKKIREFDANLNKQFLKFENIDLVRACFVNSRNSFTSILLREFGSSERQLIDTNSDEGSITQALILMNSQLSGKLLSSEQSQLVQLFKTHNDIDVIFLSMLGRKATLQEKRLFNNLDVSDTIWILLNSREFIFKI